MPKSDDPLERQFYEANPFPPDVGDEGWEFPDASNLNVVEVAQLWDSIDRAASAANKRAARLKARKAIAKDLAIQVLDATGQTSARVPVANGREVQITPYTWEVFTIKDEAAFQEWAKDHADAGGEQFYDSTPRLREGIFRDEMRRRTQDREALPPGVIRWEDVRISRTTVPSRRRPKSATIDVEQESSNPEET